MIADSSVVQVKAMQITADRMDPETTKNHLIRQIIPRFPYLKPKITTWMLNVNMTSPVTSKRRKVLNGMGFCKLHA
jgi:hypothetical protein